MTDSSSTSILTISNGLTSMRLVAAPVFYWTIVNQLWGPACLLFWLAVASDMIDGRIARARGETSAFGGILDHGSDAIFVSLGSAALATLALSPAFLSILIFAAFLQYALDSKILSGHPLRASVIGRWNGVCYFIAPGVFVTREALGWSIPADRFIAGLGWLLVASTVISMSDRLLGVISATRRNLTRD